LIINSFQLHATETSRDVSLCSHAVFHRDVLLVPDATQDSRLADNPLVAGPPGLRFYAGAPLITADGFALGTLCAIDYEPRRAPTDAEIQILRSLADAVVDALELRARLAERKRIEQLKNEFVSTVSHELRTPLTSIAGMLELLDAEVAVIAAVPFRIKAEAAE